MVFFDFDNHAASDFTNYDASTLDNHTTDGGVTAVTNKDEEAEAQASIGDGIKELKNKAKKLASIEAKAAAKAKAEQTRLANRQRFSTLLDTGEALAKQHEGYVTKSNAKQYELLASLHAFAEDVQADPASKDLIKAMREELRRNHKIKISADSDPLKIIVRFVTRTNRKNAFMYARVISKAMEEGITSSGLVAYIVKHEGINNICKKQPDASSLQKQKKSRDVMEYYTEQLLHDIAKTKPLATFTIDKSRQSEIHDTTKSSNFAFMVCQSNGSDFTVIDGLPWIDEKLEKILLEKYFLYKKTTSDKRIGEEKTRIEMQSRLQGFVTQENAARKKHGDSLIDLSAADPFAKTHQSTDGDDMESESEKI